MKKSISIFNYSIMLLLFTALIMLAQGPRGHGQGRGARFNDGFQDRGTNILRFVGKELDLTGKQSAEIRDLVKAEQIKFKEKIYNDRDKITLSQAEEMKKAHRTEIINKIKSDILTDEQSKKLDELITKRENGDFFREGMKRRLDQLDKKLELTDEQYSQLEDLFTSKWEERKIKDDAMFGPRKPGINDRDEFHDEIAKILTPEQQKKFEQMVNNREYRFNRGKNGRGYGYNNSGRKGRGAGRGVSARGCGNCNYNNWN